MPGYDGLAALALARARRPELPFIFVSGTLGEEAAIDSLKAGATDYVLKHRPQFGCYKRQRFLPRSSRHGSRDNVSPIFFLSGGPVAGLGRWA